MGIGAKNLSRILDLCRLGLLRSGAEMVELGAQNVVCEGAESSVAEFVAYFRERQNEGWRVETLTGPEVARIAKGGFMSRLMRACGFSYTALDIFDADGVVLFDLNLHSAPKELTGRFDFVTNFGTTEHVMNQFQAFKTMHELTKQGGVMYHDLPLGGYHLHGYFSYNPLFFVRLAQANGYEIVFHWYSTSARETEAPDFMTKNGFAARGWIDLGIEFIFKKSSDAPFKMPLETGTSLGLNAAVWKGEDPYEQFSGLRSPGPGALPAQGSFTSGRTFQPVFLYNVPGRELQRELVRRYRRKLAHLLGQRAS